MVNSDAVRVAVIGCGKISELGHMRAIVKEPGCVCSLLVDTNAARTQELGKSFGVRETAGDYREAVGRADACIVALPHHLHAEVACFLLDRGIHVLMEKPMAMSVAECEAMNEAADTSGSVLAIGLQRRFIHSIDVVKSILDQGLLGPLQSFDYREGGVYRWQLASDFLLRKETAGGGVLFDTGAHALDLLLYWLGDVAEVEYRDDSYGGIEAECELQLTMGSGLRGELHLSRIRELRNSVIFRGEHAVLEAAPAENVAVVYPVQGSHALAGYGATGTNDTPPVLSDLFEGNQQRPQQTLDDLYLAQLQDWLSACRGERPVRVPGTVGIRAVELMERCYANAGKLERPWVRP